MMMLHVDVRNDVVIDQSVFAWPEVPGLVFGKVLSMFEALKFVVKVQNVVGLFISKRAIPIRG